MTKLVAAALLALAFTTGFTCSKNTPPAETEAPAVEVPAETAPTEVAPPATEEAPAAPAEGASH